MPSHLSTTVQVTMDRLIVHNQKIVPREEARLSPGQAGLLLGWGIFTTLRLYQGAPFEFERHWDRMERDRRRLNVSASVEASNVRRLVLELARANRRHEGMARVILVRNTGGLWVGAPDHPPTDLLIFTSELPSWPPSYRLKVQPGAIFARGPFAGAKMLSWAANSTFMESAHAEGYDDALLLNERDEVAECTSANIFVVSSGQILTPPLSSGCLPGVTREVLLEIAPAAGFPVVERPLVLESLDEAEEVFLSSTTREVGGVREIGGRRQFKAPGRITSALEETFRDYVRRTCQDAAGSRA